jgi:CheY-like chemotaxis protein
MTKIMLVEDDKSLREIYSIRLAAEGYSVVSAGDGEEALAMAVRERPDLIISDVMMPKISGFDMLDIIRSTPETKDIKVIMMTALSSEDQRHRGENLGADMYLVKSQVGIEDVVNAVHQILGDRPTAAALSNINTLASLPGSQTAPPATVSVAPEVPPAPQVPPVDPLEPQPIAPAPDVVAPQAAPAQTPSPDISISHPAEAVPPAPVSFAPPVEVPIAPEVPPAVQVAPTTSVVPPQPAPVPPPEPAPVPTPTVPEVPPAPQPVPTVPEVPPAPQPIPEAPPAPVTANAVGERVIHPLPSSDTPDNTPNMEQQMAEILGTPNPEAPVAPPDAPAPQ